MKRNLGIGSVSHKMLTKSELIDLINSNYPDDSISKYESIVTIHTVENYAGDVSQTVLFSTILK